ncbi:MAG: hypothetical protein U5L00_18835 [Desulfovermiculus sp.]|nr:hypothetical protein [Desulfovermiculus sp.]
MDEAILEAGAGNAQGRPQAAGPGLPRSSGRNAAVSPELKGTNAWARGPAGDNLARGDLLPQQAAAMFQALVAGSLPCLQPGHGFSWKPAWKLAPVSKPSGPDHGLVPQLHSPQDTIPGFRPGSEGRGHTRRSSGRAGRMASNSCGA